MKEHQKCKEKNYFSLEKDTLLKLQQRKLKKNKSKSFKKSWVMLTEQPKRSHELSKWYKMSNWRLVCRNHDFHKKRSPIYGLKNFCLIVKWRNCLKKSFWNIAAKLKLRVKHEWQKKRDFGEDKEGSTDRDWHQKPPKNHLPTSLPCCLSWQTSDLGLSEWGWYDLDLALDPTFLHLLFLEQLKLVAWLDLASQDQVTAASRWCFRFSWIARATKSVPARTIESE